MAKIKRVFLVHGQLKKVAEAAGLSYITCSKYLRGCYDDENEKAVEEAQRVRKIALQMGGVQG